MEARIAIIAVESAKAFLDKKTGEYRNVLKRYKKLGVNSEAVAYALKVRWLDKEEVFINERERLKLLDLSGFLPGIKDRLMSRLDVEEATSAEDFALQRGNARDVGTQAGRKGHPRDSNPHVSGTELYVDWIEGWLAGQRAIADEMEQNAIKEGTTIQPPPKGKAGRPAKAKKLADLKSNQPFRDPDAESDEEPGIDDDGPVQ
jgi:hypothetical protein